MFQIISDGGCDFTVEETQKHNVQIIPFYVTLDQETFLKEGVDITKEEYFKRLLNDKTLFPKTAQPSPQDYIDVYTPYLKEGKDILSLTISSKLSGTYNSATLAATTLKEEFPKRSIIVVDSLNAANGEGLLLREIISMRDAGLSLEETAKIAEDIKKTIRIYFTLESLEYLRRGGRVGPTTALVGGILGLRPVLQLVDGTVDQLDSVRGSKKVLQWIAQGVTAALEDDKDNVNISIGHILKADDALKVKKIIESSLDVNITNPIAEVGATIGTHAGPGALVVSYCKKYENFA
jgi:DegV family protein with EDD domain